MTIIHHPNKTLSTPTAEIDVEKFGLKKLQDLGKRMMKTMYKAEGVGLAAPQIGKGIRMCVVSKKAHESLKDDLVLINPHITSRSTETSTMEEGCLSVPDKKVDVTRPVWVEFEALDEKGVKVEREADGFLARVIQHEFDHLDGILIIDK